MGMNEVERYVAVTKEKFGGVDIMITFNTSISSELVLPHPIIF